MIIIIKTINGCLTPCHCYQTGFFYSILFLSDTKLTLVGFAKTKRNYLTIQNNVH